MFSFKNIALLLGIVLLINITVVFFIFGDDEDDEAGKAINFEISKVKIYNDGAELSGVFTTTLKTGDTSLVLRGFPEELEKENIFISLEDDINVISIKHQVRILKNKSQKEKLKALKDTIQVLEDSLTFMDFQLKALDKEEEMILANKTVGGSRGVSTAEALEQITKFYRERLTNIEKEKYQLTKTKKQYKKHFNSLQKKVDKAEESYESLSEVIIKLNTLQAGTKKIGVSFFTKQVGWKPYYEFKIDDDKEINLSAKAIIKQETGLDFKNVNLIVSNQNWQKSQEITLETNPEIIDFYSKKNKKKTDNSSNANIKIVNIEAKNKYSIASGSEDQTFLLFDKKLEYEKAYLLQAKSSLQAFELAKIVDWKALQILPTKAKLTQEKEIPLLFNLKGSEDTLVLPIGKYDKLKVKKKLVNLTKGNEDDRNIDVYEYKLEISNLSKKGKAVLVKTLLPISQQDLIKVDLLNQDENIQYKNSALIWEIELEAKTDTTLNFSYQITYPKDEKLVFQ